MKIKPEHYAEMKNGIAGLDREAVLRYKEDLRLNGKYKDFDKRFRWELLFKTQKSNWVADNVYEYANDSHIDTALRNIIKELQL